jgi:hypothetical protein
MDDPAIRALVSRLARPHPSGGGVVERATLLAAGADFPQVIAWIAAHDGTPETTVVAASRGGLHGTRMTDPSTVAQRAPQRYVLPAAALS